MYLPTFVLVNGLKLTLHASVKSHNQISICKSARATTLIFKSTQRRELIPMINWLSKWFTHVMRFNFSMFIGEDGGITSSCTWLCGFVCSNAQKQKILQIPGRKNEGMDRVRKHVWNSRILDIWEQAHYNTVADGELVDLNWYPPCENKWVSEWIGWAPNWYSPHQNKWVKRWVGPNWYTASENKMRESSTLRLQLKDPPEPICTKCTRDEQRIPTLFNKGKPLVSKWVCYFKKSLAVIFKKRFSYEASDLEIQHLYCMYHLWGLKKFEGFMGEECTARSSLNLLFSPAILVCKTIKFHPVWD